MKLIAWLVLANIATAAPIDVFMFAGQSNAVGALGSYGLPSELVCPETVPFFYSVTNGETLLEGQGPLTTIWSTGGPELSFAHAMYEKGRRIAVVKVAANGTALDRDWSPPETSEWGQELAERTQVALAALIAAGDQPRIAGLIWIQGEADAVRLESASNYGRNLSGFVAALRSSLSSEFPVYISELHVGADVAYGQRVRDEQEQIGTVPGYNLIDVDDLTIPDGLHYDQASSIALGERIAQRVPEPATLALGILASTMVIDSSRRLRRPKGCEAIHRNCLRAAIIAPASRSMMLQVGSGTSVNRSVAKEDIRLRDEIGWTGTEPT